MVDTNPLYCKGCIHAYHRRCEQGNTPAAKCGDRATRAEQSPPPMDPDRVDWHRAHDDRD